MSNSVRVKANVGVPAWVGEQIADTQAAASAALPATVSAAGALVASATDKATPVDADVVALSDSAASSVLKKLSWSNIKQAIASFLRGGGLINGATVTNPKIIANSVDSIPDSLADQTVLISASASQACKIGSQTRPVGTAGTNSDPSAATDATRGVPWAADSAYPNNGIAHVACVVGGYDNICNQEAGTLIGGGHNFLPYNSSGHSVLIGGGANQNAGARSALVGGRNNTIWGGSATSAAGILAGDGNLVSASCSATIGGELCVVAANASHSGALAGKNCAVNAYYSASLGGWNNTVQSAHGFSLVAGREAKSEAPGSFTFGTKKLVNQGDCQVSLVTSGIRTTSTTATALTGPDGSWQLGSVACAVGVRASLVGVDEATGNMAFYTWDGSVRWDGSTNALVADSGGSSTTGRNMTQIYDGIGCSAVAMLAADTGALRLRVYGKAATNIKWCGRIDACAVRV